MAGVLERIHWPRRKPSAAVRKAPKVDRRNLELAAAKEILAEVFQIRASEVDEMILNKYDDVRYEEDSSEERELWPREFQMED
jgi:hypothetical protein